MSKTYKGYELIKAIADGEIKEGSRFRVELLDEIIFYTNDSLWYEENDEEVCTSTIIESYFELIEDETIDIDNIEELDKNGTFINGEINDQRVIDIQNKINELVQAVKQLDKRVKGLEELNIEINEKDINEAINKAREQRNKSIKEKN